MSDKQTHFGFKTVAEEEKARKVARKLRAGNVHINGAQGGLGTPFGGYKQSGLGREGGHFGLEEFLEVKAAIGWGDQQA